MKVMIVTDAWWPQVNGVVNTIVATQHELENMGHSVEILSPLEFRTLPCPTYPDIRLSILPGKAVAKRIRDYAPDALHLATEGPLGIAARRFAIRHGLPYNTAYHTRFPEYVKARIGFPLAWTYRFLRWFHGPAHAVMAPTPKVKSDLEAYGFSNVVLWTRGVDLEVFRLQRCRRLESAPPIFLYVGRVAVEKNIEAFLDLDLPGSKWVVGDGPALAGLRAKYPQVNYLGVLDQTALAEVYASADVFVFPSKTDTFGLVLLEAMACGLPVAAYPVTGPIDVLGDVPSNLSGGVMHENLREACLAALHIERATARAHAERFSWHAATEQFVKHLRPASQSGTKEITSLAGHQCKSR